MIDYSEAIKELRVSYAMAVDGLTFRPIKKETIKIAMDALEKQIPKKVVESKELDWTGDPLYLEACPNCDASVDRFYSANVCLACGQALDWGDD